MSILRMFRGVSDEIKIIETEVDALYRKEQYNKGLDRLVDGFQQDVDYKPFYRQAIDCLAKIGATEEVNLFEERLLSMRSFEAVYALGRHFFNEEYYKLAIPFLEKANRIDDRDDKVVHDLSVSYARTCELERAAETLQKHNPKKIFWNYWYWAKVRILLENFKGVDFAIEDLLEGLDQDLDQESTMDHRLKVIELSESIARYEFLGSPRKALEDWHFIQYGGVVLDYSETVSGRYTAAVGTNEKIYAVCRKLQYILTEWNEKINNVYFLNDRDSRIVATLIGRLLNVSVHVYHAEIEGDSLVVMGNSSKLTEEYKLSTIKEGVYLFSMCHDWSRSTPVTPELIGFMCQYYKFPWGNETISTDEIVDAVIAAKKPVAINRLKFYQDKKYYVKAFGDKTNTTRYSYAIESPIDFE